MMRMLGALGIFLVVLTATVVVFSVLGLDGPWGALGTVIAIVAAVAWYRNRKEPPAEAEGSR